MNLTAQIEALLFWKGEPLAIKDLARLLQVSTDEVRASLKELATSYEHRGLALVEHNDTATLTTAPTVADLIQNLTKEELSKDLGKAGLETLAAIIYKGPISRADIDYLRGVNSSFILRNLLIRDLIERVPSSKDSRINLYQPTANLVQYLGLNSINQMPEYDSLRQTVDQLIENPATNAEQK